MELRAGCRQMQDKGLEGTSRNPVDRRSQGKNIAEQTLK